MSRNFGPINAEGGENRLNVAISRAKRKMIVVCSFDPDGLVGGDRAEGGLASLAQYLRYAAAVSARRDFRPLLTSVTPGREPGPPRRSRPEDTSWEEEVASILAERGLVVKREVGSGPFRLDFGLALPAAPDRLVCGIECDGPSYHAPATVRDRDVVRIQQLESRGWRLHALWSPDWIRDQLGEVERILSVVAKETGAGPPEAGR
jgi:very-short-patch-repair endonuclease